MTRYVALLRGINVSGQKIIKMESLRQMFETMGFQKVITYIQSGNVIFDSPANNKNLLCENIEKHLLESLGYKVTVFLRSIPEIKEIINQNPFNTDLQGDNKIMYVSFLSDTPTAESIKSLLSKNNEIEVFDIKNREVYCLRLKPNDGKIKFILYSVEKILQMPATTRNWTTVNKLLTM
jgi:uncharacterized protein (DUF1697 family)